MVNESSTKNHYVEALRFIMMSLICLFHVDNCLYPATMHIHHGYLAVEFFFMLSGVLMYRSLTKNNPLNVFDYTAKKWKRFFPECLVALLMTYMVRIIGSCFFDSSIKLSKNFFLKGIPEALLIHGIPPFSGGENTPTWYVSILLIGGAIVYGMCHYRMKLSVKYVLPSLIILGYIYLFVTCHNLNVIPGPDASFLPLIRGVCDISLGIELAYWSDKRKMLTNKYILGLFATLSLAVFSLIAINKHNFDIICLVVIPVILFAVFNENFGQISDKLSNFCDYIGALSFQMLIYHTSLLPFFRKLLPALNLSVVLNYFISLFIIVLFSIAMRIVYSLFKQLNVSDRRNRKIKIRLIGR